MVDGVEVSVTTSKIVTDNDTKSEELRFLRYLSWHQLLLLFNCNLRQENDNVYIIMFKCFKLSQKVYDLFVL